MPYIASLTGSIYHPRHRPMMSHDAAENPSLAPELVDAVAAHLEDDADTLRSAALVSRIWCQAMRPYLFRRISIEYEEDSAKQARALQRLAGYMAGGSDDAPASPELARYVHALGIGADAVYDSGKVQRRVGVLNATVALVEALVQRGQLTELAVRDARRPLDLHLLDALDNLLNTQPLAAVTLLGRTIPGRLISSALSIPSLRQLHLYDAPLFVPRAPPRSIALEALAWSESLGKHLRYLCDPESSLDLRKLQFFGNSSPEELGEVATLLRSTGADASLKSLRITGPSSYREEPADPFDLSMLPNLTTLDAFVQHTTDYSALPWFCAFLDHVAADHPLTTLRLRLNLRSLQSMALVLHSPAAAAAASAQSNVPAGMPAWVVGWDDLDKILARGAFHALRDVHVHFEGGFESEEDAQFLPQLFPALRTKAVTVTFSWS
ncbi:hypothetical protein K525DRAFT_363097 [Schizophyllum commune Loenen D]|nr:hypothetical protein K525DRAFT_363097 [Schizophyllum commune Loenen D]